MRIIPKALDTIRNDLIIAGYDLKECGLEDDPIHMLYSGGEFYNGN